MLFLAVTLGFFVENQREHYIERVRAKEFSKTLVKDLQNDTAAVNTQTKFAKTYIAIADSLLALNETGLDGPSATRFSFYTRFMYWTAPITWNRATFEQIKNSGSLRYFKNHELLEKMMKYEAIVKEIEMEAYNNTIRGNLLLKHINIVIKPTHHHELSKYYLASFDTMSRTTIEHLHNFNSGSLKEKMAEISEMLNMIIVQQRNLQRNIDILWPQAKELAVQLISDLRKQYHLK